MGFSFVKGKQFQELEEVTNFCSEAIDSNVVTLEVSQWLRKLNELSEKVKDAKERHLLVLPYSRNRGSGKECSISEKTILHLCTLMRCFHSLYEAASLYVPLPLPMWNRWKEGLLTFLWSEEETKIKSEKEVSLKGEDVNDFPDFPSVSLLRKGLRPADASTHEDGRVSLSTLKEMEPLLSVRKELLEQYEKHFDIHLWGSSFMVGSRLFKLLHELESKRSLIDVENGIIEEQSEEISQKVSKTPSSKYSSSEALWFKELHEISRLCKDSRHLFMEYSHIGLLERMTLTEKLENLQMEGEDKEVELLLESVLRRSFKRDFAVPSFSFETKELESEYENFEVDSKKQSELKKIAVYTEKSSVLNMLSSFYSHLQSLQLPTGSVEKNLLPENVTSGVNGSTHLLFSFFPFSCSILDEKGTQLADSLTQLWSSASSEDVYTAFAFTMQRIVQLESFPPVLNPARVLFVLHLFCKWWKYYVRQTHRWNIHSTFVSEDDEDLMRFMLERHEMVLRYALSTPNAPFRSFGTTSEETLQHSYPSPMEKIEALRVVTQSVICCLGTYLSNLEEIPMASEKAMKRRERALSMCLAWLEQYIVGTISVALMNEIYSFSEHLPEMKKKASMKASSVERNEEDALKELKNDEGSNVTEEEEEDVLLVLEGKLKVVLLDAFVIFSPLFPAVQEKNQVRLYTIVHSIMNQLKKIKMKPCPSEGAKKLWSVAFQLLQRAGLWLPIHQAPCYSSSSASFSASRTFVQHITSLLKSLLSVASEVLRQEAEVEAAAGLWMVFSSQSIHHHPDSTALRPSSPPLVEQKKELLPLLLPLPYDLRMKKKSRILSDMGESSDNFFSSAAVSGKISSTTLDIVIERRKSLKRLREE